MYIFMSNRSFMLSGPHVVLFFRVLDFALHHTIYYSSGGLSVQSVSQEFLCQRLCERLKKNEKESLNKTFYFVLRLRRTFYKTLKEEIQEVEAAHVSN